MNANIMKMQIFHKIKYNLRGHSRSQIMTFLMKNSPFLLFMLLIDWRNKCRWTLWKNDICLDLNLRSYGQLFVHILAKYRKYYCLTVDVTILTNYDLEILVNHSIFRSYKIRYVNTVFAFSIVLKLYTGWSKKKFMIESVA